MPEEWTPSPTEIVEEYEDGLIIHNADPPAPSPMGRATRIEKMLERICSYLHIDISDLE